MATLQLFSLFGSGARDLKYLLYSIFGHAVPPGKEIDMPLGVEDRPVFLLTQNGLHAALSEVNTPGRSVPGVPDLLHLLTYKKVIESFHGNPAIPAVIPMRYGCFFAETSGVFRLLEEHGCEYQSLLQELEGCVEMGIRVIFPPPENQTLEIESGTPQSAIFSQKLADCGGAYLASRRAHYAREEQGIRENRAILEKCQAAFSRVFVKCRSEIHAFPFPLSGRYGIDPSNFVNSPGGPRRRFAGPPPFQREKTGGLYFLIPRSGLESFRQIFGQVALQEPARLLLSGPWPPYNFVIFP
jgi:hypothetical protein